MTDTDHSSSLPTPWQQAPIPTIMLEGFSSMVRQAFAREPDTQRRFPQLERFLQQASFQEPTATPVETLAWQCATRSAALPPVAALCRLIDAPNDSDASAAHWLRADPVWLRADLTRVYLAAVGNLALDNDECAALSHELTPWLAELDIHIDTRHPQRWYVRLPAPSQVELPHPLSVVGEGLEDLWQACEHAEAASNAASSTFDHPFWLRLSNEIQMLLHAQPLNEQRRQTGLPEANSLWFWGAGQLPERCDFSYRIEPSQHAMLQGMTLWQQSQQAGLSALPGLWHWCPLPGETPLDALARLDTLLAECVQQIGGGSIRLLSDEGECWIASTGVSWWRLSWWRQLFSTRKATLLELLPPSQAPSIAAKAGL